MKGRLQPALRRKNTYVNPWLGFDVAPWVEDNYWKWY